MPKKRTAPCARARSRREIERDVLTKEKPIAQRLETEQFCGACLMAVESDSQLALIDSCEHIFHPECVQRWANTENTCPQCKMRFFWIAAYTQEGQRTLLEKVQTRDQEADDEDSFEDVQTCERCKEVGDETSLLLCDGMHGTCNAAFHFHCVGLPGVPRGSWFCPDCTERGFDVDAEGRSRKRHASGIDAVQEQHAQEPEVAAEASTEVAESVVQRGVATVPSQLRLNALACVSPPVAVPNFVAGGVAPGVNGVADAPDAEPKRVGLFANFAARRRARLGLQEANTPAASKAPGFISLNPSFEEDFMGKTLT